MKNKKVTTLVALSFWTISCAHGALAGPCTGYTNNSNISSQVYEPAKGQSMVVYHDHSITVADDPKSPLHARFGECAGTFLTLADGKQTGSGYCTRKDKDGDITMDEWALAPGADKGTWKIVVATGKFKNLVGSTGWWQFVGSDGKRSLVRFDGDCKL